MQGSEDHLFLLSIRRADSESALALRIRIVASTERIRVEARHWASFQSWVPRTQLGAVCVCHVAGSGDAQMDRRTLHPEGVHIQGEE